MPRTILVMPVCGREEVEVAAPEDEVATGMTADEPSDEPEAYDDDIDQEVAV